MDKTLHQQVRDAEHNMINGTATISQYVDHSLYETLSTIDAYLNSKHISGLTDSLGREKPFFNVVVAAANVWFRATDLDTKGVILMPPSIKKTLQTYAAYALLQDWMRENNFAAFLNKWGLTLARYGSAVCKFIEVDGKLIPSVVPWNRMIVDPVDFDAIPRIEKFYKTPAQLINMATKGHPDYQGYDLDVAKELIDSLTTRKTGNNQKDDKDDFIELYEVHGELSQAIYKEGKGEETDDEDEDIFFQQMHVMSFTTNKSEVEDFTLYAGKEKKDPYILTHLLEEDGRTLGKGAVEYLFDAQWMVNHTNKNMKDYFDLASKLLFQTSDPNFLGRNVLTAIETGNIFITKKNEPITQVSNTAQNITSLMNYANQWRIGGQDTSATPDALRGTTQPSGTSGIHVQSLQEQALSLFDMLTENKKNSLNQMIREFVIPNLLKHMDTVDEVAAIFNDDDITKIDAMYIPNEAVKEFNNKTKEAVLSGKTDQLQPFNPEEAQLQVQQALASQGNTRTFKPSDIDGVTWKKSLKDFEWKVVIADAESTDKRTLFAALQAFVQTVKNNPFTETLAPPPTTIQPAQQGQPQLQAKEQLNG